ncbi:MAG TPA: hypothetical protein VMV72_19245 [Verrucomicrobiae bacterium]|nr:hypothetical protein [Verrucomicrobiae bacterium]
MRENSSETIPTGSTGRETPGLERRWVAPTLLLVTVFVINFVAMPGTWWPGDPFAWREETRSLLRDGALHVDTQYAGQAGERGQYFVVNPRNGLWYSKYGLMNSLMAVPPTALEAALDGHMPRLGEAPDLLIFNLYNILLSLILCGLLYRITGWYTARTWVRVAYVLCAFYATFFWYYQRAQGAEIYQVLFFTAAFYFLMTYLRGLTSAGGESSATNRGALLAAWMFVGALVLTRVVFGLLIPTVWLAVIYAAWSLEQEERERLLRREAGWLVIPALLIVGALAWINWIKFGEPWLTGYHQWRPQAHAPTGRWQDGLWGVLFDPQASMLLHFPILIFGLFAMREFWRRYQLDAVVMFLLPSALVVFLTKMPIWRGEWAYGPRLLIFMLPVLSLPFIVYLDRLAAGPWRWRRFAMVVVTVVTLGYSTWLQYEVNRLDFWTMYRVLFTFDGDWSQDSARYFFGHQMGTFNADLIRHKDDLDGLPYVAELEKRGLLRGQDAQAYKAMLRGLIDNENFYWLHPPRGETSPRPSGGEGQGEGAVVK